MKINCPLEQALHIALNLNLPVFPCRPDKRPYTKNGFKDATTDMTKIKNFWLNFRCSCWCSTGKYQTFLS